ncbi:MAG: DUF6259 domain-containing protein, partial [Defluviitaleaceae bacterium]|nr:DUF6259 domain-containing protein [Defluviitaleaceae bacterium]
MINLKTSNTFFGFDENNLRLKSVHSAFASEQNFITDDEKLPVFEIGYYDAKKRLRTLDSFSAKKITVSKISEGVFEAEFGGFETPGANTMTVSCRVSVSESDGFARFGVSIKNRCSMQIFDVRYPFVVCPYKLDGTPQTEAVVLPQGYGSGRLLKGDLEFGGGNQYNRMRPDSYQAWEFSPYEDMCGHYPGLMFAQFLAYYNDRAGLYISCDDTQANVKRFRVLHRKPGMRLGVSHAGDWSAANSRSLEYETLITTFTGDWYAAADIYREWSFKQKWFVPLANRDDIPKWLTDSPAYITVRSVGQLDMGDTDLIEDFVPYEKCLPLLQNVADKIDAPLCVVFMGWERAGSWVYPDCFPPAGGEESFAGAIAEIRNRGWHAGSFCSGTRWCYDQVWSGYDGRDYLDSIGAEDGYCKTADGQNWVDNWRNFRMNIAGCLAAKKTRDMSRHIVDKLVGWGMDAMQFLDQNNGSATFPCFSEDHGHDGMPGKWMHEAMRSFMLELHESAREMGAPGVVHSAESGLNEVCLPFFQQTEL